MTSCHNGTVRPGGSTGSETPSKRQAQQQSGRDRDDDEAGIDQPGGAEMDAAGDKVQRAIEEVRSRHQDHAWADRDEAQRRAQIVAHRQRADQAGEQRRAEWLQENVRAELGERAAQNGAGAGAHEYQHRGNEMLDTEDHRQRHGARRRRKREQPCRRRRRPRDRADRLHRGVRRQPPGLDILDRPHRGSDAIHVHAGGIGRLPGRMEWRRCRTEVAARPSAP